MKCCKYLNIHGPGWGPDPNFCLIRLSRPKLSLIRLSRCKLTLIRLSRHKGSLIRLFRPKMFWSDHLQTIVQTQIQTLVPRPWSNYDQTQVRSKSLWSDPVAFEAFMVRPSCACSHLWLDWSALKTGSDQTQMRWKYSEHTRQIAGK